MNISGLKNILIVDLLRIGDTVVTFPAIRAVRENLPEAHITLVASANLRPLIEEQELADDIAYFDCRKNGRNLFSIRRFAKSLPTQGYDLAIVLDTRLTSNLIAFCANAKRRIGYNYRCRGFLLTDKVKAPLYWNRPMWEYSNSIKVSHEVDSWLKLIGKAGFLVKEQRPHIRESYKNQKWCESFLKEHNVLQADTIVCIHPGSNTSYQWKSDRFAQVGDFIIEKFKAKVCISGGPDDADLIKEIENNMHAKPVISNYKMNLVQYAELLRRANLLVSVDTSATHIASAVNTPVIALFGPGDPGIWRPYGEEHIVIQKNDALCVGCKKPVCKQDKHYCMDAITVEEVCKAVYNKLQKITKGDV
ncbi:glycosyltransferase family 9 protein [bacterium]|nr:glycosyltransferase family 9 protein [bacterium]